MIIQIANTILELISVVFSSTLELVSDAVVSAVPQRRKTYYDADFEEPEKILGKNENGFHVSTWSNDLQSSHKHMIVLGGSGSHKSTSVVFTTILKSHDASMIVHAPDGEAFLGTAQAKYAAGYEVSVLDCNHPERSEGFNVLATCRSHNDIYKVANILVRNSLEGTSYDFWAQSAEATIALFCKLLTYAEPQFNNLPNVLHLLQVFSYAPGTIDKWVIAKVKDTQLISEYKSLVATPERTLLSILSSAKTALRIYSNPNIALISSFHTIDFDSFKTRKKILYLCSSASDAYLFRSITATFFESFFGSILSTPPDESKKLLPLMFLIDEASVIKIELSSALALTRKHSTSILTLWQDLNQIEHLYGKDEAANIFANSNLKVFMPSGAPIETCTMLERLLGEYDAIDEDGTIKRRKLLSAQEIHELNKILVLNGNSRPTLLQPKPYFEQKELRQLAELPAYEVPNKLPFDSVPFIQIKDE